MRPERFNPVSANHVDMNTAQICMFVRDPFLECHCITISSANIPKIIAVCGDKFRSCPIYRRALQKMAADEAT